MLNQINVIGRLGAEPEMRFTPNGVPVTSFRIAVSRKFTKSDGEKGEETDWFTVSTWNKTAESCNQYLVKGQLVFVTGRVTLKTWEKQDGTTAARLEITASNVIFLTKPKGAQDVVPEGEPTGDDFLPEDIPF